MKPIEEGCLAIVIHSRNGNNGLCVVVGKLVERFGVVNDKLVKEQWEVDPPVPSSNKSRGKFLAPILPEFMLMRIDGEEFEQEQEQEEELVNE